MKYLGMFWLGPHKKSQSGQISRGIVRRCSQLETFGGCPSHVGWKGLNQYSIHSLWPFYDCLVVWNMNGLWLSIGWECHNPNCPTHIFQRSRSTPSQLTIIPPLYHHYTIDFVGGLFQFCQGRRCVGALGINTRMIMAYKQYWCVGLNEISWIMDIG
jgi:hypothetical protein